MAGMTTDSTPATAARMVAASASSSSATSLIISSTSGGSGSSSNPHGNAHDGTTSSSNSSGGGGGPDCTRDMTSKFVNLDPVFMTYYFGFFALVAGVNLVGNFSVLRTFFKHRSLWSPSNAFICSLALSDLIFGAVFPIYNVAGINTPGINNVLGRWEVCRLILVEVLALEICSAYGLVAITACRYICTAYPLRYHAYVTTQRCLVSVAVLWVVSHTVCIYFYAVRMPDNVSNGAYCRVCRYEKIYTTQELVVLIVIQCGLPVSLMLFFYVKMACLARTLNNRVASESVGSSDSEQSRIILNQRRNKGVIVVALLVGCFAFSYLPMIIYFIIVIGNGTISSKFDYVSASVRIILFMNTAVNVFIYAGRMVDFRDFLRRDMSSLVVSASHCRCC